MDIVLSSSKRNPFEIDNQEMEEYEEVVFPHDNSEVGGYGGDMDNYLRNDHNEGILISFNIHCNSKRKPAKSNKNLLGREENSTT